MPGETPDARVIIRPGVTRLVTLGSDSIKIFWPGSRPGRSRQIPVGVAGLAGFAGFAGSRVRGSGEVLPQRIRPRSVDHPAFADDRGDEVRGGDVESGVQDAGRVGHDRSFSPT